MEIKTFYDKNAFELTKAHDDDAGFDIRTPYAFTLYANSHIAIDTGVHIEIPKGYVGFLKSKSGLNVKNDITSEGVIDAGFRASMVVKLYNNGDSDKVFDTGDKITQIVLLPIPQVTLKKVESLDEFADSERGENGFGSSGK